MGVSRSRRASAALAVLAAALALVAGRAGAASAPDTGVVDVDTALDYQGTAAAGTGIVFGSGLVLTNNHVIRGATRVRVTDVATGRRFAATVLGYDVAADVAVLRVTGGSGLATAPIRSSGGVGVGDPVTAVGNAGGVGGRPSSSPGTVVGLGRTITAVDDEGTAERLTGLIETDASLEPGDSGGPLLDAAGRVIGMDTAAATGFRFRQQQGDRGYAIPIAKALAVARRIVAGRSSATTHVGPTPMLGVRVVAPDLYNVGSPGSGAYVVDVVPGSPADLAGVTSGAVITALGGRTVTSPATLGAAILRLLPNARVTLAWIDQFGTRYSASVRLATGPPR